MIGRPRLEQTVRAALRRQPVVALTGPRQCGKTTLARRLTGPSRGQYFDLEDHRDVDALGRPLAALDPLRGGVVLDEIQRIPALFEVLRVLADRPRTPARFLVLGSASPTLVRGVAESLAGRVRPVEMGGLALDEVGNARAERLWLRGGYPRAFLAPSEAESVRWREDLLATYVERDVPQLGLAIPAVALRRFWTMLAHDHGQVWNAAELARTLGTAESTARRYLDVLVGGYLVRALPPWHENLGKRQIKSPKIYVRDTGLLHALLGIPDRRALLGHPKAGASFEGFVVEQVLARTGARDAYFWGTYQGAELDLLLVRGRRRIGFEVKWSEAPKLTASMRIAVRDLGLTRLGVVHVGTRSFDLAPRIRAMARARARVRRLAHRRLYISCLMN